MTQMLIPSNADQSVYPPNDIIQTAALLFAKLSGSTFTGPNTFFGGDTGTTASLSDNTTKLATTAFVQALVAAAVPSGTIIDFSGTVAPTGYLACPTVQTDISRTGANAALFAAIGTTWGAGNGTTTFGMPWFIPDGAGVQASANVGTQTTGAVISHTHNIPFVTTSPVPAGTGGSVYVGPGSTPTGATGGTNNLAAGSRILKCVKL